MRRTAECVVDDPDVDVGVTDLYRAGHELHDDQVLPAGHDLDEAQRRRTEMPARCRTVRL